MKYGYPEPSQTFFLLCCDFESPHIVDKIWPGHTWLFCHGGDTHSSCVYHMSMVVEIAFQRCQDIVPLICVLNNSDLRSALWLFNTYIYNYIALLYSIILYYDMFLFLMGKSSTNGPWLRKLLNISKGMPMPPHWVEAQLWCLDIPNCAVFVAQIYSNKFIKFAEIGKSKGCFSNFYHLLSNILHYVIDVFIDVFFQRNWCTVNTYRHRHVANTTGSVLASHPVVVASPWAIGIVIRSSWSVFFSGNRTWQWKIIRSIPCNICI
jgi:hypothetical protein